MERGALLRSKPIEAQEERHGAAVAGHAEGHAGEVRGEREGRVCDDEVEPCFRRLDRWRLGEVSDDDIDAEFAGAVQRLAEAESKRAFAVLQQKVYKLGVAGLSSEEKQHYLRALARQGPTA